MGASGLRLRAAMTVGMCALAAAIGLVAGSARPAAAAATTSFTLQVTGSSTSTTFFAAPNDVNVAATSNGSFTGTTDLPVTLQEGVDTEWDAFNGYATLAAGAHPDGICSSLSETHTIHWTFAVNGNSATLDQPVTVSWICNNQGQIQLGSAKTTIALGNGEFVDITLWGWAGGTLQFNGGGGGGDPEGMTLRLHGPNSAPVANAGPEQTIELGDGGTATATLDGTGSSDPDSDPLTYTWTGDFAGGRATGATPTVVFNTVGSHTVTLSVDDGQGHTATATTVVHVGYGFQWLTSGPLAVQAGSAVPLAYRTTGAPAGLAPIVTVTDVGCALGSTADLPQESGTQTGSPHNKVVWVWKTPKSYAGSCKQVSVDLGDGIAHQLDVTFPAKR